MDISTAKLRSLSTLRTRHLYRTRKTRYRKDWPLSWWASHPLVMTPFLGALRTKHGSYQMLLENLQQIWKRRDFYVNVLNTPGQNSLFTHALEKSFASALNLYLSHHGEQPSQEEIYQFHFFTYGWINTLLEWLKGDYSFTPEELATLEYNAFPALITDTWKGEAGKEETKEGAKREEM